MNGKLAQTHTHAKYIWNLRWETVEKKKTNIYAVYTGQGFTHYM